jgi:hypothetical protein
MMNGDLDDFLPNWPDWWKDKNEDIIPLSPQQKEDLKALAECLTATVANVLRACIHEALNSSSHCIWIDNWACKTKDKINFTTHWLAHIRDIKNEYWVDHETVMIAADLVTNEWEYVDWILVRNFFTKQASAS